MSRLVVRRCRIFTRLPQLLYDTTAANWTLYAFLLFSVLSRQGAAVAVVARINPQAIQSRHRALSNVVSGRLGFSLPPGSVYRCVRFLVSDLTIPP